MYRSKVKKILGTCVPTKCSKNIPENIPKSIPDMKRKRIELQESRFFSSTAVTAEFILCTVHVICEVYLCRLSSTPTCQHIGLISFGASPDDHFPVFRIRY